MKKVISSFLAVVLLAFTLAGCGAGGTGGSGGSAGAEGTPIRVATMVSTAGVPIQFAYEQGFFEDEGLNVELIYFPTGAPINEAYAAGQIDVAASGMASVFSLANAGAVWIGEINTAEGMGIFARADHPAAAIQGEVPGLPNILGSAETVRGMQILGALGTTAQFMAMAYADRFGLTAADFDMVHMDHGPGWTAFQLGEGDAAAVSPPFSFEAMAEGYITLATFEDATGVILRDGLFATPEIIENRRDEMVRLVRAVWRAQEELQDFGTRFQFSMDWFNAHGITYDEFTMTSEINARTYINAAFMQQPGYVFGSGMTEIGRFFTEQGTIPEANFPNIQRSFDASLLWEALDISFDVDTTP